jgi:CHASE2 domain-containing sensor protein
LPLPLEGVFRGMRNELRARPADQSIAVIAIDAKTVRAYGTDYYSRSYNAKLLDQVFSLGAKGVYFDEAFSQPGDPAGDQAFADALTRHKGRVFSGAMYLRNRETSEREEIVP